MEIPCASVVNTPWPPLPTNLGKNKVVRFPSLDPAQVAEDAMARVELERHPLRNSKQRGEEKVLIPEIELAIYWDRHAYEYRKPVRNVQQAHTLAQLERARANAAAAMIPVEEKEKRDTSVQCSAVEISGQSDMGCQTSFRRECRCYCKDCKPKARAKTAAPKLVRSVETNTSNGGNGNNGNQRKSGVSKTEYRGKFRNPARIAEVENRILKQKVLNRCFNESIL